MNQAVIYGTVVEIKDGMFWYLACTNCHTKLNRDLNRCSKCGCLTSHLRYRLVLEVDTKYGLLCITVFGDSLNKYFGVDCSTLNREALDYVGAVEETSRHLIKCVDSCFVGSSFIFQVKNQQLKKLQKNILNTSDEGIIDLAVHKIERFGHGECFPTVLEKFNSGVKRTYHATPVDEILPQKVMEISNSKLTENRIYDMPKDFDRSDKDLPCSIAVNTQNSCKLKLHRSLSDSFAFLQDSLIQSLFQLDNQDFSECKILSQGSMANSNQFEPLLQSNPLKNHSMHVPKFAPKCITAFTKRPSQNYTDLSFCQLLYEEKSMVCFSATNESTKFDILDDITLPVLDDSKSVLKSKDFTMPINLGVPKLRRCRSLILHNYNTSTNCQNSNNRTNSLLANLNLDMFSDSMEISGSLDLNKKNCVANSTTVKSSQRTIKNKMFCNQYSDIQCKSNIESLAAKPRLLKPSSTPAISPVSSSTPKQTGSKSRNCRSSCKKRTSIQSPPTGPDCKQIALCMSPDLFNNSHDLYGAYDEPISGFLKEFKSENLSTSNNNSVDMFS